MTYYDILGVPYNATADQIKRAYREQIRFFHPDVFQGSEDVAKIKTQQLNEAYAVLSDPRKRAVYDFDLRRRSEHSRKASEEPRAEEEKQEEKQAEKQEKKKSGETHEQSSPEPEHTKRKKEKKQDDPEKVKKRQAFFANAFSIIKVAAAIAAVLWILNGCEESARKEREQKEQELWDEAYQSGYDNGLDDGYEEGYMDGESSGYAMGETSGYDQGHEEGYLAGSMDTRFEEFDMTVYCDDNLKTYHAYNDCPKIETIGQEMTQGDALGKNYQKCYPCFEPNGYIAGFTDGFNTGFAEGSK